MVDPTGLSVALPSVASYTTITGYIRLWSSFASSTTILLFPQLHTLGGFIDINNSTNLVQISFPVLSQCVSIGIAQSSGLTSVSFPLLTSITHFLYIQSNKVLTSMSLPSIQSIGTYISICDCTSLVDTVPNIIQVCGLRVCHWVHVHCSCSLARAMNGFLG
jgi:hypothetical protein